MKKLFSVLKYTKNYKSYTALNIIFNILFAILSASTLALIAPFLDLLFKNDLIGLNIILQKGLSKFSFSSSYFQNFSNYYLAFLIIKKGKIGALILI